MATDQSKPLPVFTPNFIPRFWGNVDKSPGHGPHGDCWPWIGARDKNGYGAIGFHGRCLIASRVAYYLYHGEDPYPLGVLHSCDFPPCCRDSHLFKGTDADNMADMARKGRARGGGALKYHPEKAARGEQHPRAKLSKEDVLAIRFMYAQGGITHEALAEEFGVSRTHVSSLILRRFWSHI